MLEGFWVLGNTTYYLKEYLLVFTKSHQKGFSDTLHNSLATYYSHALSQFLTKLHTKEVSCFILALFTKYNSFYLYKTFTYTKFYVSVNCKQLYKPYDQALIH